MVTGPARIPESSPEDEPIEAMTVLLLVHVPPGVASVNVVVRPAQRVGAPVMGIGRG